MNTSVRWLNQYLDPANVTAEGADDALTRAGFPIEEIVEQANGDVMLDVEVTSNRGDCLSQVGLAREVAAVTGRKLRPPERPLPEPAGEPVQDIVTLDNRAGALCPIFTVRVVRGARVGPSPDWLQRTLESVGQRSINNIVDVTNYVMFELGQPSHVFDLDTIEGKQVIVRKASAGEPLELLDGRAIKLKGDEVVVADANRAISLAGVMGGAATEVSDATTNVLVEAATWDPVAVRTSARRFNCRTDASHRFERIVDARTVQDAAEHVAALIVQVAGGELAPGVLAEGEGAAWGPREAIELRPARVRHLLGVDVPADDIAALLSKLGVEVTGSGDALACVPPPSRPDLTREVDLIEEVARIRSLDALPMAETIGVRAPAPDPAESATRLVGQTLAGLGFYEAITFSFTTRDHADLFLTPGAERVEIQDERRKNEPALRPSVLSGLMTSLRANHDAQSAPPSGVRLFEAASVFRGVSATEAEEGRALGLVADGPAAGKAHERAQHAIRVVRGALDRVTREMGGPGAELRVEPLSDADRASTPKGFDPDATGRVLLGGETIGLMGLASDATSKAFDLDGPVAMAEVALPVLVDMYPPPAREPELAAFPAIERDLSVIASESVTWNQIRDVVAEMGVERLEAAEFVGTYRGKPLAAGEKSVTLRLRFRDPARTLRHEEVDPSADAVVAALSDRLGVSLRA